MEYSRGLTKGAFITILVTQYSGQFNHSVTILYTALTAMSDLLISHQNLNNQCNQHKEQKKTDWLFVEGKPQNTATTSEFIRTHPNNRSHNGLCFPHLTTN